MMDENFVFDRLLLTYVYDEAADTSDLVVIRRTSPPRQWRR